MTSRAGSVEAPDKPVPTASPETVPYWEAAGRGELLIRRCDACGHHQAPDLPACIRCGETETSWVTAEGDGTIVSFVTYRRSYHPAYADDLPYVVALIELVEGVRMVSNILGRKPEDVRCGLPVTVEFEQRDEQAVPQFRVTGS